MTVMSGQRLIVPLPTYYGGVKFKSALEARWAMYFDEINVAWRYEDEGYALPSGRYLPDFWLPVAGMHAEVKSDRGFSLTELQKCADLAGATQNPVLLLDGPPRGVPFYLLGGGMNGAIELSDVPVPAEFCKGSDDDTWQLARIGDAHGGYFALIDPYGEVESGPVDTIAVNTMKSRLQRGEGVWIEEWGVYLPYGNQWLRFRAKVSSWEHLLEAYEYTVARNARRTFDGRLVRA